MRTPSSSPDPAQLAVLIQQLSVLLERCPPPRCLTQPGMREAIERVRDDTAICWLRLALDRAWRTSP